MISSSEFKILGPLDCLLGNVAVTVSISAGNHLDRARTKLRVKESRPFNNSFSNNLF
jgi:hypothetical protein